MLLLLNILSILKICSSFVIFVSLISNSVYWHFDACNYCPVNFSVCVCVYIATNILKVLNTFSFILMAVSIFIIFPNNTIFHFYVTEITDIINFLVDKLYFFFHSCKQCWLNVLTCVFWYTCMHIRLGIYLDLGFSGGSEVKNPFASAGDMGLNFDLGRSPGEGNGNALQYSCKWNPMDRGIWWVTVNGVKKKKKVGHNLVAKPHNKHLEMQLEIVWHK